ncbi:MAG: acetoacetate--CoA ligase [Acidimicrobiales bacterium]
MPAPEIVWTAPPGAWERSRMAAFATHVSADGGPALADAGSLVQWSIAEPSAFWAAYAAFADIRWHAPPTDALVREGPMPATRWFPGGTLSYADAALAQADDRRDEVAVVGLSQTRARDSLTWGELTDAVARCRAGLLRLGVRRGNRVVAYAPNITETLVAMLATASLGAIWSSCPPEFGEQAVIDRFSQIEPTVMLAVDGYRYGQRELDRASAVEAIAAALPSLQHVVPIRYLGHGDDGWGELLASPGELVFEPVPFDHPLWILFSSGTTGLPKAIVHGHGGMVLEHHKVLALHHDLRPGERFSWFTTTGWMMWNYLVSGLLVGATVVLFDGDPGFPDLSALWTLAADERLDVLGVSAPFVMACSKASVEPRAGGDLGRLREVGVTGAPLPPDGFRWLVDAAGPQVRPSSLSGGTDVCTAFVGPMPSEPVRAGVITSRLLGCDVQAVDDAGRRCLPGDTGELVIAQPMPSMPVGFWGDHDGSKLRSAYFERVPGMWCHGDWITFDDQGGCVISGRSDATLNRGGVRLGTSDFYAVVDALPEIADSVVVHLEDTEGGPGRLILLVVCTPEVELSDGLADEIRRSLRQRHSPRHVPDEIHAVDRLPRTMSGKKLEIPVKRLLLGHDPTTVAARDSLDDPEAFDRLATWAAQRRAASGA